MKNIVLSLSTAMLITSITQAQELRKIEDVTVTAQKVAENPKDVPITINVFDEFSIEDKKIDNIQDMTKYVPSFFLFNTSDNGTASPSLRGVYSDFRTLNSSVAMYIDGIPSFVTTNYNTFLYDIQRVEVLKGPQSTLYGKNAQAGVINVITKQPDNEFRGKVSLELGQDNKRQATFNVSTPIVEDKFFAGFAARYYEKDGFIKNTYLNKNINDKQNYMGRLNLRYLVNDNLELSLIGSMERRRDDGGNTATVRNPDPYNLNVELEEKNEADVDSLGFKIKYHISENKNIEAISAYKKSTLTQIEDYDKTANPNYMQHAFFPTENKTISQELRYNQKEDNYNYILGLYTDKSENDTLNKFETSKGSFVYGDQKVEGKNIGVFAHIDYQLSEKFSVIGGLRYDKDKIEFKNRLNSAQDKKSFSEVSPKLALKYQLTKDTLAFATIAKGYKPGGFYIFAPLGQEYYKQETLLSYEIGLKSSFFDNKLNLNTALYYIDISDKQIVVPISNVNNYIRNADSANSKGFELEAKYMISDTLTLNSSFAYNKATFDDFKYTSLIFDQNYNVIGKQNIDNSGNYMPNTPKYTYSLGLQYRGESGIYANVHLNGFGDFFIDDSNIYKRKAYSLVDTKLGYETENYDIYLYGKNIFDKDYSTKEHYGSGFIHLSKPREIGIQLVYRF